MRRYQICVYAISKDEEAFVDRWMNAVGEADLVVVTDTGSTDHTVENLRARGAVVYEETISPWRFDAARNAALSHVPTDMDLCVSNDLDEVFDPGWRQKLEDVWKPMYTRARYLFTWSYRADGVPEKQYPMEKIHRRDGYRWVRPIHEILSYTGTEEEKTVFVPGLVLNHHPDLKKPRGQYLPLLELAVSENPQDDRAVFWLGREYFYHGMYDKSIKNLQTHLALPSATWDEERAASMRFLARCWAAKGRLGEARKWLFRALAECQHTREPYLALATLGYREENWPLVYAMAKKGLAIEHRGGSYLVEPACWGAALYDYGAIAAYHLALYEEARTLAKRAIELENENDRLKSNLAFIEEKITAQNEVLHETQ